MRRGVVPPGQEPPGPAADDVDVVLPSRDDRVARASSAVLGGGAGRRVRASRNPVGAAAGTAAALGACVLVGAVLLSQHCRQTLWASPGQFLHACYSDIPTRFLDGYLDQHAPYLRLDQGVGYLDQPFGVGWLLWLLGLLAPDGPVQQRWVFDLAAVLLVVALAGTVTAVAHLAGRRPWDAVAVALSPVLLVSGLVGLQLVAVALATGGLWASARRRPVLAGLLLGVAAVVTPVTGLVLLALVLVAWRRRRDAAALVTGVPRPLPAGPGDDVVDELDARTSPEATGRTAVAAALAWLAVGLPVLLVEPAAWWAAVVGRFGDGIGYGSPWLLPDLLLRPLGAGVGTALAVVGSVLVVLAVAVLVLGAPRPPRVPVVALLLVVGVLAVGPALPPQSAVVVLPLAVLAVPRWSVLLVWGAVEAAAATATWLYLYGFAVPSSGLPPWAYGTLLVARLLALAWVARWAVVGALDPARDPVRTPRSAPRLGQDDPARPAPVTAPAPPR